MSNEDKQSLIEGITLGVVLGIVIFLCAIGDRLNEIKQALQSSISYAGGSNLNCLKYTHYTKTK